LGLEALRRGWKPRPPKERSPVTTVRAQLEAKTHGAKRDPSLRDPARQRTTRRKNRVTSLGMTEKREVPSRETF